MSERRGTTAWLMLAIRQRQWQAELEQPELREALEAERCAEEQRQLAQTSLQQAEQTQGQLQGRLFTADALVRHMTYTARQQHVLQEAVESASKAVGEADRLRGQAQALLAERDALQEHLDGLLANARMEQQRRESRAHDEHWLLRGFGGDESTQSRRTEDEAR